MMIDERLESLAKTVERMAAVQEKDHERIDALSRNVELLVHMHMDNEKLAEERLKLAEQRHQQNEAIHAEMMLALARLSLIAQKHEQDLDELKDR